MRSINESFLELKKKHLEDGFWDEQSKVLLLSALERAYRKDIIREWGISDVLLHGDRMLLRWYKRIEPLTEEQLKRI